MTTYTKALSTRGDLLARFSFQSEAEKAAWIENELPEIRKKYGKVSIGREWDLPGLQVGDTCCVCGEGDETFEILALIMYSPHRPGFLLSSGYTEEVAKCFIK